MTKCATKCKNECKKSNNNKMNNINNKRNTIPIKYVYFIIAISLFIFISSLIFSIYYLFFHRKGWVKENAELIDEDECYINKYKKCYTIKININGKDYIRKFDTNKKLKITEIDGKKTIEIEYDPSNPKDNIKISINKDLFKIIISLILLGSAVIAIYFFIYKYYKIVKGINKIKIDHDLFM